MATIGHWQVLTANVENAPKLLVRAQFKDSGYEIELTDLSNMWRESVTKEDIIQRASDTGSSIDPGQDNEQFWIFLSKIQSALNGDEGTSLSLHAAGNDGAVLSMELSTKLPHPLPAFVWNLQLELIPRQDTERLLVTPLLHKANNLLHQIDQLVFELHDKDRVISKICDRLETSGNDLTTVFPGVSNIKTSRKRGQREQLARHVKGLGDFDHRAWSAQHANLESNEDMDDYQLDHVLESLPISSTKASSGHADWWQNLGKHSQSQSKGRNGASSNSGSKRGRSSQRLEADESIQDDDFQTQSTPPHLKHQDSPEQPTVQSQKSASKAPNQVVSEQPATIGNGDDSETEDEEDDLDAAPRKPPPSQASPRKLGVVGGRSTDKPSPSVEEAAAPEEEPVETKPRSKLGKIGGKAKAVEVSTPAPQDNDEDENDDLDTSSQAKPKKVGVIGGKKSAGKTSVPDEDAVEEDMDVDTQTDEGVRSSRATAKPQSPAARENSQERADRKRDQQKRQLEDKAKAPVKKKRKF